MKILEDPHCALLFSEPAERIILKSAYSRYNDLHDPLRCCLFSLLLRELIRIAMARIAPDSMVRSTKWFIGDKDRNNNIIITKRERYRYAISGELHDDVVREIAEINVRDLTDQLAAAEKHLSKFAHLDTKILQGDDTEAHKRLLEVEYATTRYAEAYTSYSSLIDKAIEDRVRDIAQAEVEGRLRKSSSFGAFNLQTLSISGFDKSTKIAEILCDISGAIDIIQSNTGQLLRQDVEMVLLATINTCDLNIDNAKVIEWSLSEI